ncbi:MAG: hypothetical protein JRJ20_17645, partial [Deltaproteobacteria bacterium]|nr:hypothetical protein [Deltaproteobacteria bacterium]
MSQEAKEAIIHERGKNGRFVSLKDFLDRTGPHVHLQGVRVLIKAGCLDSISCGTSRPGLMWQALSFFHQKEAEMTPTLFDQAQTPVLLRKHASPKKPYPKDLMLKHESETLGF